MFLSTSHVVVERECESREKHIRLAQKTLGGSGCEMICVFDEQEVVNFSWMSGSNRKQENITAQRKKDARTKDAWLTDDLSKKHHQGLVHHHHVWQ